jgi:excisionase family DNA binding protein
MIPANTNNPEPCGCNCKEVANAAHRQRMTPTIDTPLQKAADLDPLLTLSELATFTRTPVSTLYSLRSAGRSPIGFRLGRSLRFRRSDVEAWISGLSASERAATR